MAARSHPFNLCPSMKIFPSRRLLFLLLSALPAVLPAGEPVTVDALVAEVLAQNPEVAFYEAELEAARAGLRAAATRENPAVSVELGRKRAAEAGLAAEGTAWSVTLSQTFEWPGRLALRKAVANHDIALAELGLARFKAALTGRARVLAHSLRAAHERAAAAAEVAARYQALREVFLAREPGGITPLLETRVIEAQELTLQRRATDAQLAVQAALLELNRLRGRPADTPVTLAGPPPAFAPAPALEAALAAARENNFDFRAARLELEQQGFMVSLARHEGRPAFTVSPYYARENAGGSERTFGLGFSVPLPVNGRTAANTAAAEARRRQAGTAVLVAQRNLEQSVISAARRYAAKSAEAAKWAPEAAARFREAAELADRHYRLGAVPISTYVELQHSYLEAIDALYATQQEALEAGGELQLLTGLSLGEAAP
jgi:cobalt-zinc-cadmium efflux system outer membrane protein